MNKKPDAVVIGAGPAGLAAAVALKKAGVHDVLVVEREDSPGGVLMQCIHNGFGIHRYGEELTGPEYAERGIKQAREHGVDIEPGTAAIEINTSPDGHTVYLLSESEGAVKVKTRALVLAMGCREKNRGNLNIPGSRPAGIMTAGLAQRLVNIEGSLPGREVVVLGSGDIGLIMARRLSLEGVHVKGVVEMQPFPGGLNRNIVQCLFDFNIPLHLSHTITRIIGNNRIEAVEISPIVGSVIDTASAFTLTCDCLLLSTGLIPENELSQKAGVTLDQVTRGPVVNSRLMTSVPGIFACGNVLHVHDLVDWVSEEAELAGTQAAHYLEHGLSISAEVPVKAGNLVRYAMPARVVRGMPCTLSLRPLAPAEDVELMCICSIGGFREVFEHKNFKKVVPSSMIHMEIQGLPEGTTSLELEFRQD